MLERILDPESAGGVSIIFEKAGVVCVFDLDLGAAGDASRGYAGTANMPSTVVSLS